MSRWRRRSAGEPRTHLEVVLQARKAGASWEPYVGSWQIRRSTYRLRGWVELWRTWRCERVGRGFDGWRLRWRWADERLIAHRARRPRSARCDPACSFTLPDGQRACSWPQAICQQWRADTLAARQAAQR